MATKNATNVETKVEDLKEEPKTEEKAEIIVQEDSKVRKIITWGLKGLAVLATGVVGFILGRTTAGNGGSDSDEQEESTTEE